MNIVCAIEAKPEHYVGFISVTIRCRPSERAYCERLITEFQEAARRMSEEPTDQEGGAK